MITLSVIAIASFPIVPVAVISVVAVIAPVTASVEPLKLKLDSAVIGDVPVPVRTALSVKLEEPVPPSATVISVIPVIVPPVMATLSIATEPVPAGSITIFSFDLVPFMSASETVSPSVVNDVAVALPVIVRVSPDTAVEMLVPPAIVKVFPGKIVAVVESSPANIVPEDEQAFIGYIIDFIVRTSKASFS